MSSVFDQLRATLAARAPARFPVESIRPELLPEGGFRQAAVLVPLFEQAGEANVLLTRRRLDLRQHAGQVSFPGGRIEQGEVIFNDRELERTFTEAVLLSNSR